MPFHMCTAHSHHQSHMMFLNMWTKPQGRVRWETLFYLTFILPCCLVFEVRKLKLRGCCGPFFLECCVNHLFQSLLLILMSITMTLNSLCDNHSMNTIQLHVPVLYNLSPFLLTTELHRLNCSARFAELGSQLNERLANQIDSVPHSVARPPPYIPRPLLSRSALFVHIFGSDSGESDGWR